MGQYEQDAAQELAHWQKKMKQIIPEKVHQVFTAAIKQMVRGVLAGSGFTNPKPCTR